MSTFWAYFIKLWPFINKQDPLAVLGQGLGQSLDKVQADAIFLRQQFFPQQCAEKMVLRHGFSRGLIQHHTESKEQFRTRVINAYAWHMLGGKQEGLPQILNFYGFHIAQIEDIGLVHPARWAEFHVGLHDVISSTQMDNILNSLDTLIWLINEYKPARSILSRLYTSTYDCRPIVLSHGPVLGDGWLSYYSGVPASGHEDVLISFGLVHKALCEAYAKDLAGSAGIVLHLGLMAPYLDRFIVSRSALSDLYPRNHGLTISSHFSILWADRATLGRTWQGLWDERRWQDYTGFDRKLPLWRMEQRKNYFSQAVPSWDAKISNINARLGGTFATIINNPAKLGDFKLSNHDAKRLEQRLEKMFINNNMLQSHKLDPKHPYLAQNPWLFLSPKAEQRHGQTNFNLDLSLKLSDHKWQNFENNIHLNQAISTNSQLNSKPHTKITSLVPQFWTKTWDKRSWGREDIILVE